jgi:hypothetical protein
MQGLKHFLKSPEVQLLCSREDVCYCVKLLMLCKLGKLLVIF